MFIVPELDLHDHEPSSPNLFNGPGSYLIIANNYHQGHHRSIGTRVVGSSWCVWYLYVVNFVKIVSLLESITVKKYVAYARASEEACPKCPNVPRPC